MGERNVLRTSGKQRMLQRLHWRQDLQQASREIIKKTCPNWKTNSVHNAKCKLIREVTQKKNSPRTTWLREKCYDWLKSPPPEVPLSSWYPDLAVQVAHQIFLPGKFQSLVKYLKKK